MNENAFAGWLSSPCSRCGKRFRMALISATTYCGICETKAPISLQELAEIGLRQNARLKEQVYASASPIEEHTPNG